MTEVMGEIFIITFTQLYTEFHINWLVPVLKSKCHVIKDKIMEFVFVWPNDPVCSQQLRGR